MQNILLQEARKLKTLNVQPLTTLNTVQLIFTGDGTVNIDDIYAILGLWGPCD